MDVSVVLDFDVETVMAVRALTTANSELNFTSTAHNGLFTVNFTVVVLEHSDFVTMAHRSEGLRQKTDDAERVWELASCSVSSVRSVNLVDRLTALEQSIVGKTNADLALMQRASILEKVLDPGQPLVGGLPARIAALEAASGVC
jgi:hypothetical protein